MGLLRFVLALSVLLWHVPRNQILIMDGGLAVLTFFVISGFFISMILHEKYQQLSFGWWRFIANRLLRIFPLFLVAMLLQQLYFSIVDIPSVFTSSMNLPTAVRGSLIFMNFFKIGQDWWQTMVEFAHTASSLGGTDPVYRWLAQVSGRKGFTAEPGYLLVGQGWSLASELSYYLLAPLLVFLSRKNLLVLLVTTLIIRFSLLFHFGAPYGGSLRTKFFPAILVFFLLGQFSYLLYVRVSEMKSSLLIGKILAWSLIPAVAAVILRGGFLVGTDYDQPSVWVFYLLLTGSIPFLFLATRSMRVDSLIGDFSYPIYLIHGVVIAGVDRWISKGQVYYSVGITLILSWILILVVEHPIHRLRTRVAESNFTFPLFLRRTFGRMSTSA